MRKTLVVIAFLLGCVVPSFAQPHICPPYCPPPPCPPYCSGVAAYEEVVDLGRWGLLDEDGGEEAMAMAPEMMETLMPEALVDAAVSYYEVAGASDGIPTPHPGPLVQQALKYYQAEVFGITVHERRFNPMLRALVRYYVKRVSTVGLSPVAAARPLMLRVVGYLIARRIRIGGAGPRPVHPVGAVPRPVVPRPVVPRPVGVAGPVGTFGGYGGLAAYDPLVYPGVAAYGGLAHAGPTVAGLFGHGVYGAPGVATGATLGATFPHWGDYV